MSATVAATASTALASTGTDRPVSHLVKRADSGTYRYVRRVPEALSHRDPRDIVKVGLKTRDIKMATKMASELDEALANCWADMLKGHPASKAIAQFVRTARDVRCLQFRKD